MNREEGVTFLIVSHEMADAAPALPPRLGHARRPAHRGGLVRGGGQPRRWSSKRTWGAEVALLELRTGRGRLRRGHRHPGRHRARAWRPGTLTGIIGPNGAGKSTLLKTIFGFLHPRGGRIVLRRAGHPAAGAPRRSSGSGISYVPQGDERLPPAHRAGEPAARRLGVPARRRARVAQMLERAYATFPRLREKRRRAPPGCAAARPRCSRSPRSW